jgi:hypothetical protein
VNSDATLKSGAMILVCILSSVVAEKLPTRQEGRCPVKAQVFTSYICSPILSLTLGWNRVNKHSRH